MCPKGQDPRTSGNKPSDSHRGSKEDNGIMDFELSKTQDLYPGSASY